jgi:predicted dehydrogenase
MYRLAIVGAGQLGSRHLQGLARLAVDCEIDVVDPSSTSLEVALQRFEEMPANEAIRCVRYHASVNTLPKDLDFVVVATSADVRFSVLESLFQSSRVRTLLLEKVLFQRVGDYAKAQELIKQHGTKAWVNCPRRAYAIYSEIREFFAGENLLYAQAIGGDWGLGCNGIHFIDLFAMLTRERLNSLDTSGLDKQLIPSKRKGFIEFTGFLRGSYVNGASIEIASLDSSSARLLITLRSEHRTCIVDETAGYAFFSDSSKGTTWERNEFKTPFLSELITGLVSQILDAGTCPLPTFEEAVKYHLPFIKSMGEFAVAYQGGSGDLCLIT